MIEKIYLKYFQRNNLNISYVENLKKVSKNNLLDLILPAFDQAIFDIHSKEKKLSVSKILNKKTISNLNFYASGGMFFEGQNYEKILNEAVESKKKISLDINTDHQCLKIIYPINKE